MRRTLEVLAGYIAIAGGGVVIIAAAITGHDPIPGFGLCALGAVGLAIVRIETLELRLRAAELVIGRIGATQDRTRKDAA